MKLSNKVTSTKTIKRYKVLEDQFNKIHNFKYDYSNTIFYGFKHNITYLCPEHGEVTQKAMSHKNGAGCQKCAWKNNGLNRKKTEAEVINLFNEVHGDYYDYSLINYDHCRAKIDIICPIHGVFSQEPAGHYNGQGCPKCAIFKRVETSKYNTYKNKPTILYYIKIGEFYKIGLTQSSLKSRFRSLFKDIEIIKTWNFEDGWNAFKLEQYVLKKTERYKPLDKNLPINEGKTELRTIDILNEIIEGMENEIFSI